MQNILFPKGGVTTTGGLLDNIFWDWFTVAYPSTTQEVYSFYSGGPSGTLVATIQINYTTSAKDVIASGGRV